MHIYSRIQDAIIELLKISMLFSSYHPVSWCMMVVWTAPSRQVESQAVIHQDHHQKAGQLVFHECTRETGTCLSSPKVPHFLFFSWLRKKKTPPPDQPAACLPAIAPFFGAFFPLVWSLQADGKCWCYLGFRLVSSLPLGSGHFGRWFSLPKNGGPCRLGLKLTTNSHISQNKGWLNVFLALTMWFMAYGVMMFTFIMALRAKLSGDGFQFEVLLSWICGGDTFPLRFLVPRVFKIVEFLYHGSIVCSNFWKNPRWVQRPFCWETVGPKFFLCIQVEDKTGPQVPRRLAGTHRKSFIIWKTMTVNSNLDHLEFVPKNRLDNFHRDEQTTQK